LNENINFQYDSMIYQMVDRDLDPMKCIESELTLAANAASSYKDWDIRAGLFVSTDSDWM
jgi:hypothetical protein